MDEYSTLLKYKELLDEGILTKEEFETKKRELLFAEEVAEEKARKQQEEEKNKIYTEAVECMELQTYSLYVEALGKFEALGDWKDSEKRALICREKIYRMEKAEEEQRKEAELRKKRNEAASKILLNSKAHLKLAIHDLEELGNWGDAPDLLAEAKEALKELEAKEEEARKERKKKIKELLGKKQTKAAIAAVCLALLFTVFYVAYIDPVILQPGRDYDNAVQLLKDGDYTSAERIFKQLGDYKDSAYQIETCKIKRADMWVHYGYQPGTSVGINCDQLLEALDIYNSYSDNNNIRDEYVIKCKEGIYQVAKEAYENKSFNRALELFAKIEDFSYSKDYIEKCNEEIGAEKSKDTMAFIEDGVYTGTLTDIIEVYEDRYSVFSMTIAEQTFGGHIKLSLKDNKYEGNMKCFPSKNNIAVTIAGMNMSADQYINADQSPEVIFSTFESDRFDALDIDCIALAMVNLLSTIDSEIDQEDAYKNVIDAMSDETEISIKGFRIQANRNASDQKYEFKVFWNGRNI